ncbi:MAG: SAM-dependent methyltransferase [Bacteroidales bacterium]|nr:SAM-dependent methyltransferase [Bacteroidales bacterium]
MDTRQFIEEHLNDDVHELALKHSNAKVDMALALRQIEARQLLRKKVPSWSANPELLFPSHLSIEQCSSEASANYKASLMKGESFADLTGGLGIDCYYISQNFQHSDYVEHNPELCALARHNYEVLGAKTMVVHNDSAEVFLNQCEPLDCLFIDPARRDVHGRKVVSVSDCTPNVVDLQDLMLRKAKRVMVKLSPMLDISQALKELHYVKEIHIVAVENECKELLFILEPEFDGEPVFTCVNLQTNQSSVQFTQEEEKVATLQLAKEPIRYLYEPNAALMKGGCFKLLSQRFDVQKLHRNSHLYTSEKLIENFPGRIFEINDWAIYGKKAKALLDGIDKASIAVRNFPMTVAELRKKLKIGDGDKVFLFATTMSNERFIILKTTPLTNRF